MTKAHVRYLEGRLIEQAKAAGRALVMNGQSSGSKLPESDREDMEIFLERIHQLMPVLGTDALQPIGSAPAGHAEKQVLVCEIKGLKATGHLTPSGFLVLRGSQAVLKERASAHQYPNTLTSRKRLIEDGTLVEEGNHYKFTRDSELVAPVLPQPLCTEDRQTAYSRGKAMQARRSRNLKRPNLCFQGERQPAALGLLVSDP